MKLIGLILIAFSMGAANTSSAQTPPLKNTSLLTCTNTTNSNDRFSMMMTRVLAPNSVNLTTLTIVNQEFRASGEFQPSGEIFVGGKDGHGSWVTVFVSWALLKSGQGPIQTSPFKPDQKTYNCRTIGAQG